MRGGRCSTGTGTDCGCTQGIGRPPGYPDNLMQELDGRIWLGFGGQRNDIDLMARPFLRRLTLRIPRILWKPPQPYGHLATVLSRGRGRHRPDRCMI